MRSLATTTGSPLDPNGMAQRPRVHRPDEHSNLKKTRHYVRMQHLGQRPEYQARSDFTLAYSALPCAVLPPTGQKPLIPSSLRAFLQAADAFLLTILPDLLFIISDFAKPLCVFTL